MATPDTLNEEELAANYGYALGFLKAFPELYAIFKKATTGGGWSNQRFIAAIRNSQWYRSRSEASRQVELLKKTDPGEYVRRLRASYAQVADAWMSKYGTAGNPKVLSGIARQMFQYGLTESEVGDILGRSANIAALMKKGLGGSLGEAEQAIRKGMEDYGVDVSDSWMAGILKNVANGTQDTGATIDYLRNLARSKYSAFANQIDQGMTIREIAEPYRQLMAKTLEVSDQSIGISDRHIQQALLAVNDKHQPAPKPLWQFEADLKNDPRWMGTQSAQDQAMSVGRKVLEDMGMLGASG